MVASSLIEMPAEFAATRVFKSTGAVFCREARCRGYLSLGGLALSAGSNQGGLVVRGDLIFSSIFGFGARSRARFAFRGLACVVDHQCEPEWKQCRRDKLRGRKT